VRLKPRLTPRQRTFLNKLLELYRERKGPIHYSDLAERLGVNRFSAYDMLKVLEKKGLASSSYALRSAAVASHPGPGRSMVVFSPTPEAARVLAPEGVEDRLGEEWRAVRSRVLVLLQGAQEANYREALDDLLSRLPEARAPLVYCTEMVGALLLNMQRARTRAGGLNPFGALASLRSGGDTGLETLAGLSVGVALTVDDESEHSRTQELLDHVRSYQSSLSRLSAEARSALVQFLEEALEALD
jgi:DNA-binding MarR family transcriptional regulator